VFKPRTTPGVLRRITRDGVMVFDDIHSCPTDVKKVIESFSFEIGDGSPTYYNGALQSKGVKQQYDVDEQSLVFLYNVKYDNPKDHWENLWQNPVALRSRFLRVLLEGKLTEPFDKDFDIVGTAEEHKMLYIRVAKHLLYLKQLRLTNKYQRQRTGTHLNLKGRHKIIYDEITWLLDQYCESDVEYQTMVNVFNTSITEYQRMVQGYVPQVQEVTVGTGQLTLQSTKNPQTVDDVGASPQSLILAELDHAMFTTDELEEQLGIENIDAVLADMAAKGDIFQAPGFKWRAT